MIDLSSKVAVVTGGGRGLGKAMCLKLAAAGARVVLGDLNDADGGDVVKEIEAKGGKALYVNADVSDTAAVENLINQAVERFGGVDILVNNAGISVTKPFMHSTVDDLERILSVNVKGVYNGCKAVIPQLVEKKGGKIINIASMAGKEGFGLMSLYSATKFAVIGMTQALSKELGEFNINVNAVCPGLIKTKMWTNEIMTNGSEAMGVPGEAIWESLVAEVPLKRAQTEENIADMVVFLSSDMASEITGQALNVNGGQVTH